MAVHSGVPRRGLRGGLEPLPLEYDLRNICVRIHQNVVFSTKNTKNFLGGGGTAPSPDPSQVRKGIPLPSVGISQKELGVRRRSVYGGLASAHPLEVTKMLY